MQSLKPIHFGGIMITAILHYCNGSSLTREIPTDDRFKKRHLDDLTGKTIVGHDFEYRPGQSEQMESVHFDEIDSRKPLARAARAK
jgi:hypothetical protein